MHHTLLDVIRIGVIWVRPSSGATGSPVLSPAPPNAPECVTDGANG